MNLKFNAQNISEKDKSSYNIFKKHFLNENRFKDILIINVNEAITLWLFENCLKYGSGLGILQHKNNENFLDDFLEKYNFRYLILPKSLISKIKKSNFHILNIFPIYDVEYTFIEIIKSNIKVYPLFSNSIILFTSGSSGERKPVIISHKSIIACSKFMVDEMCTNKNDVEIVYAQLDHAFALGRILSCAISNSSFVFINSKRILTPNIIEKFMQFKGLSGLSCMPSVLYRILQNEEYLDFFSENLKYVQIGAMFLPANKKIELVKKLPKTKVFAHYGMTEYMRATFFELSQNLNKAHTEGKASDGTEIKIIKIDNKNNKLNNIDGIGEILLKGPHLASGYLASQEWDERSTNDGYFKTGDIGFLDDDGFLVHKGRKDNIFNFQGKLFSSTALQAQLEKMFPSLENNIVIFPHRSKESLRDTELNLFLFNIQLNKNKYPPEKEIKKFFLSFGLRISIIKQLLEIPRTANGKISYGNLESLLD